MKNTYDVIVVGGGPGGITCAALLAKKGVKTLVLEKNDRVGGRPATVISKGFTCERWPTGGLPVKGGSWLEAFKALGIESKFRDVLLSTHRRDHGAARQPSGRFRIESGLAGEAHSSLFRSDSHRSASRGGILPSALQADYGTSP